MESIYGFVGEVSLYFLMLLLSVTLLTLYFADSVNIGHNVSMNPDVVVMNPTLNNNEF